MKVLKCGNLTLNNTDTRICVPITGKTLDEITHQAKKIKELNPDVVEWRADYYYIDMEDNVVNETIACLNKIHCILNDIPLIFTIRSKKEGGKSSLDVDTYTECCANVAKVADENNVSMIDVESYEKEYDAEKIIAEIHEKGVKVIGSYHNFSETPSKDAMMDILTKMEEEEADVCKLAVMPLEKGDADRLISASKEADQSLSAPIITMSMGELGEVTRVCTRLTGSVITFAAGPEASAPGQPDYKVAKKLLEIGKGCKMDVNIALIGFMGTGKTTVSKALSRITEFQEIDVDKYIVDKEKHTINEIFEAHGEEYFRNLETQALMDIQKESGRIISCGGGAVLKDENVDILKKGGVIVLLTATPETIFDRVKGHTHRPILNNDMSLEHVKSLMDEREPRYRQVADICVNVDSNDRILTCYNVLVQLEKAGYIDILQ